MDVADHWHGYTWVGHERPADPVRMDHSQNYPSIEIAHYLLKPARHVAKTFANTGGSTPALDWMRECGTEHPHLSDESFPLEDRLEYTADDLRRGADVVWGYYTPRQRYVTRALVACPRGGQQCPYGGR